MGWEGGQYLGWKHLWGRVGVSLLIPPLSPPLISPFPPSPATTLPGIPLRLPYLRRGRVLLMSSLAIHLGMQTVWYSSRCTALPVQVGHSLCGEWLRRVMSIE